MMLAESEDHNRGDPFFRNHFRENEIDQFALEVMLLNGRIPATPLPRVGQSRRFWFPDDKSFIKVRFSNHVRTLQEALPTKGSVDDYRYGLKLRRQGAFQHDLVPSELSGSQARNFHYAITTRFKDAIKLDEDSHHFLNPRVKVPVS